jgi:hypothetical protein
MALSVSELQTIVYTKTAASGLFSNEGPNEAAFALQAIIDDINYCLALSPPDTVRAQILLDFANTQY